MGPTEFRERFVEAAIALWRERPDNPVLAVCAISQVDILAEVVALAETGDTPARNAVRVFRDDLGQREPALERVRSAHDSHKHGRLGRSSATEITEGQRPYSSAGTAFFADHSFVDDFLGSTSTAILTDDGKPLDVGELLSEAVAAWDREFARLGIEREGKAPAENEGDTA